jgi:AhpC/TSA family protein
MDWWFVSQLLLWLAALALVSLAIGLARMAHDVSTVETPGRSPSVVGTRPRRVTREDVASRRDLTIPPENMPSVLVFASPTCSECRAVLPVVAQAGQALRSRGSVIVIIGDDANAARPYADMLHGTMPVVADPDGVLADAYGITRVPYAILVDREGEVRSASALAATNAGTELLRLLSLATRQVLPTQAELVSS